MKRGRILIVGSAGPYVLISSQPLYSTSQVAVLRLTRITALLVINQMARTWTLITWAAL